MEQLALKERVDRVLQEYEEDPFRLAQELKKLLKEAEKAEDFHTMGRINLQLSICVFKQGRRDSILAYAYKAVSILENLDDYVNLARSYNLLGVAYAGLGNFSRAMASYHKALALVRRRKKTPVKRITLLNNIGDAYYEMGVYKKSLRIALNCLSECKKKTPDDHAAAVLYGCNIYDSYNRLGEYKKAKEIMEEVRPDADCLPDGILLCGYYTRLSCALYANGDGEGGAKYTDAMLRLAQGHYDSYEFHPVFDQITSYQIEAGDYDRARRISVVLSEYAEKSGHTLDQIMAKRVQGNLCVAAGEMDQALVLFRELNTLNEDWINQQTVMQYEGQKSVDDAAKEIAKLMRKIQLSDEKANRDPLTGLLNRSAMTRISDEFMHSAKDKENKLGGVFIDIDYFKEYNDTYGHAAGDEAIKLIARICLEEESDRVKFFRYGGDEFFGIVLGHRDEKIEQLALRIAQKVRASEFTHIKNPNGQRLTVSVGVVNEDMKSSGDTILDIMKHADRALYCAKEHGRNEVFVCRAMADYELVFRPVVSQSQLD